MSSAVPTPLPSTQYCPIHYWFQLLLYVPETTEILYVVGVLCKYYHSVVSLGYYSASPGRDRRIR